MKIKIYFRKNLKLTPQKLAASCAHVTMQLGYMWSCMGEYYDPLETTIVVLMASDKKFNELKEENSGEDILSHLHVDHGFTEVEAGTEVAFGYIE